MFNQNEKQILNKVLDREIKESEEVVVNGKVPQTREDKINYIHDIETIKSKVKKL